MASRKGMDGQGVAASPRPLRAIDREKREKEYRRRRSADRERKREREQERETEVRDVKTPSGMKKNNLEINGFVKIWKIFIMHGRTFKKNSWAEESEDFTAHSSLSFILRDMIAKHTSDSLSYLRLEKSSRVIYIFRINIIQFLFN